MDQKLKFSSRQNPLISDKESFLSQKFLIVYPFRNIQSNYRLRFMDTGKVSRSTDHHLMLIGRAKDFMRSHFQENISLLEIADYCNVSLFHFSRLFKHFTAYSPHQFLLEIRLTHAEELVKNSTLPIMDICFNSGFNSLEHFTTMFRARFKKNPREYRKQIRNTAIR